MTGDKTQVMAPDHPRWDEFVERLEGPEGCDFTPAASGLGHEWTCSRDADRPLSRKILRAMGLSEDAIAASFAYFDTRGGYCDCEVIYNVNPD